MSNTLPSQLKASISALKSNQHIYSSKLTEITTTRQQISQQLQQLQLTYDKKIKQLEHKLLSFQQENQHLVKQNLLFQNQIGNFQSRLLEKEKIIALLLQQKKDINFNSGSDRSKSEQNQSAKASEEGLKKDRSSHNSKLEEGNLNVWGKKKEKEGEGRQQLVSPVQVVENREEVQKAMIPPPPKKKKVQSSTPAQSPPPPPSPIEETTHTSPHTNIDLNPAQVFQSMQAEPTQVQQPQNQSHVNQRVVPPPPRPKKKSPKQPKRAVKQQFQQEGEQRLEQNSQLLMSYFSNNNESPQLQENTRKISEIRGNEEEPQNVQTEGQPLPQVIDPNSQAEYQEEGQYRYDQAVEDNNERQKFDFSKHFATEKKDPEANNFLEHFSQDNHQEEEASHVAPAKRKKKAGRAHIQQASDYPTDSAFEPSFNSSEFFQQMGKGEPEPSHSLDIEESSIDHIDRDSSVLSNEQPYFTQEPSQPVEQLTRPKPMKMTKKKAKRDQIKVVDPSEFA